MEVYEKASKSASDAVINASLGTAITNIAVNTTADYINKAHDKFSQEVKCAINAPPPTSSRQVFAEAVVSSTIGVAPMVLMSKAGIELFKKYNKEIPEKYIPNFNILLTAIVAKYKEIEDLDNKYNECFAIELHNFVKNVEKKFNDFNNDKIKNYTHTFQDGETIEIYKIWFDFDRYTFKSKYNNTIINGKITRKCNTKVNYDETKKTIMAKITDIKTMIDEYQSIFNIAPATRDELLNASKEIAETFKNINVENMTDRDIDTMKSTIAEVKKQIEAEKKAKEKSRNTQKEDVVLKMVDNMSDTFIKNLEKAPSMAKKTVKTITSIFKPSNGGKSSTLVRRKTMKRRKQRI
jgi:hypothetical protein